MAASLTLLGLLPGCSKASHGNEQSGQDSDTDQQVSGGVRKRELPKVRVEAVTRREMVRNLETMTKLESESEIELFPLSNGVVTAVLVEEGDAVEKDQVLAELDNRDESLMVDEAEVQWRDAQDTQKVRELTAQETEKRITSARLAAEQAERNYQRNLSLYKGASSVASGLSKQALEDSLLERDRTLNEQELAVIARDKANLDSKLAKTAVTRALVGLDRARLTLSNRRVLAPFAGVIARRDVRMGASASTAAAAFVLSDVSRLRAVFARPQEELSLFRNGLLSSTADGVGERLPIAATAEALPGVELSGQVLRISPTIDKDSGQFRVTARLDNPDSAAGARLLPGMLVRMSITTDRHPNVLVVPKRALRREGDRRYVLVIVPGQSPEVGSLRRVAVREGFDNEEFAEVQAIEPDVLGEGDLVIVIGGRDLVDGDQVALDVISVEEETSISSGDAGMPGDSELDIATGDDGGE